jgi:hypothetical protein
MLEDKITIELTRGELISYKVKLEGAIEQTKRMIYSGEYDNIADLLAKDVAENEATIEKINNALN